MLPFALADRHKLCIRTTTSRRRWQQQQQQQRPPGQVPPSVTSYYLSRAHLNRCHVRLPSPTPLRPARQVAVQSPAIVNHRMPCPCLLQGQHLSTHYMALYIPSVSMQIPDAVSPHFTTTSNAAARNVACTHALVSTPRKGIPLGLPSLLSN
jgi:hypothetical protein